ncbi:glycine cleavage system protein GcvH [Geobacter pelophilus]|jgi:glycine cleavage system H protein|uniref:Glycine cleavage system H protein n=1 Tax=Geoanaerobacter pelophilus TaxID=60036 RepID=A0AAW4L2P7_9BACT|nr:glycine cleavage system protein GcvH [Geoanaerobacter pelophilus]MBT0665251.1 glycine cleavage system protein GcvH [Geoanaerobacter pelophilus]
MPATYYTKEHEWVKIEGNIATIGITDFAAHQLGDVTFVELPATGKSVKQFEVLCAIESVKAASDIYAPVSGKVVSINEALETTPEIVNESAESAAWMACLEMSDTAEVAKLLSREQYEEYLKGL